ncbi:hypothetical protein C0J52_15769 [Blattella germanica]|nr:hypothetical protein C0J52_15769 [Blattella germanica]
MYCFFSRAQGVTSAGVKGNGVDWHKNINSSACLILSSTTTLYVLRDRITAAKAEIDRNMLQMVWKVVDYRRDVSEVGAESMTVEMMLLRLKHFEDEVTLVWDKMTFFISKCVVSQDNHAEKTRSFRMLFNTMGGKWRARSNKVQLGHHCSYMQPLHPCNNYH